MSDHRAPDAMSGARTRALAAQVVHAVRVEGRTLDDALRGPERQVDSRDRALLRALAYGTVRWQLRLAAFIEALLDKPLRPRDAVLFDLLAVGLFQLDYMRVPARAAVHATVTAAGDLQRPHARGLVNAVLRRFQREGALLGARLNQLPALQHAFPAWLVDQLAADWPHCCEDLLSASNEPPPMWLRVNRAHGSREAYLDRLRAAGLAASVHPEAPDALCLATPVEVELLPGWDRGDVSVQDAAAQLAPAMLALAPGQRVLDACAAPGGKTAHLLECTPALGEVVALDISAPRLEELQRGLARLGLQPRVLRGDASRPEDWWDGQLFDRILLDAPCSATGVIRRHPDIKLLRRADDLPPLLALQARMLDALWPLLAPGGRLVYATCSVLRQENELQVAAFLQRNQMARLVAPAGAPDEAITQPDRQIMTGETNMDGFYYACLEHAAVTTPQH